VFKGSLVLNQLYYEHMFQFTQINSDICGVHLQTGRIAGQTVDSPESVFDAN